MKTILKLGYTTLVLPDGAKVGPLVDALSKAIHVTPDVRRGFDESGYWHYGVDERQPGVEIQRIPDANLHVKVEQDEKPARVQPHPRINGSREPLMINQ